MTVFESIEQKDIYFMEKALEQARLAAMQGEVPVGAVIVKESKNRKQRKK